MTFESMSSSRADNKFERMLQEVHAQRGPAPAAGMPLSARETEDTPHEVVSARAAAPESGKDDADETTVRQLLAAIDAMDGGLYHLTTPYERARVRRATCPPNASLERALQTNPTSSLLASSLLAVAAGVLLGAMMSPRVREPVGYAMRGATSASTRAVERMLEYA